MSENCKKCSSEEIFENALKRIPKNSKCYCCCVGPKGETGPTGETGPVGETGPAGPATELKGFQVMLNESNQIENEANIIFNEVSFSGSDNIYYDNLTGIFTVTKLGNYYISWTLSVDGAFVSPFVKISLSTAESDISTVYSPNTTALINGSSLLTVTTVPFNFYLKNISEDTLSMVSDSSKGNLTVLELS